MALDFDDQPAETDPPTIVSNDSCEVGFCYEHLLSSQPATVLLPGQEIGSPKTDDGGGTRAVFWGNSDESFNAFWIENYSLGIRTIRGKGISHDLDHADIMVTAYGYLKLNMPGSCAGDPEQNPVGFYVSTVQLAARTFLRQRSRYSAMLRRAEKAGSKACRTSQRVYEGREPSFVAKEQIRVAMQTLNRDERIIIDYYFFRDMSLVDCAKDLGVSDRTVYRWLESATVKMRDCFEERGWL